MSSFFVNIYLTKGFKPIQLAFYLSTCNLEPSIQSVLPVCVTIKIYSNFYRACDKISYESFRNAFFLSQNTTVEIIDTKRLITVELDGLI